MNTRWSILAVNLVLLIASTGTADAQDSPGFDFVHVELAMAYFETRDETILDQISTSDAAIHLKKHSDRTGYYPPEYSARDITQDLLREDPGAEKLSGVKELIAYARDRPERIDACFDEAVLFLPEGAKPSHPVYVTWGYDIGVSMDGTASLNFTHPHFLGDRQEIWYYCIHENHHAGLTQIHQMPYVADLKTADALREFVLYATMLEGTAVFAAYGERRHHNALNNDPDYVSLQDAEEVERIGSDYRDALVFLRQEGERELNDVHWAIVEAMSSGERWWYVTGAQIAMDLEKSGGRHALIEAMSRGPAFFTSQMIEVQNEGAE